MPALCGQECCHRPPDDLACREVVLARMSPKIAREALRHLERNRNRALGNRRRRSASSRQFEIAIGLSSRQAELARQRHGSLRHASSVREQPPRRSQSVGLLCSRRTNHMTQRYYRLRRKSTTFLPRKPIIARSNWKLSFAFREPRPLPAEFLPCAARRCRPPSGPEPSASVRCRVAPTGSSYDDEPHGATAPNRYYRSIL